MGNLRQSMTEEEWNELGKKSKENKQPSMKYTIDTQNKTIIVEQCSVYELTDLLTKLKQVHSDIHLYDIISKTITLEKTIPFGTPNQTVPNPFDTPNQTVPNPYIAPIVPYTQPMLYEDMFRVYCTTTCEPTVTTNNTNRAESKI